MLFDPSATIRLLLPQDYNKNYLRLLQQLTSLDPSKVSLVDFNNFITNLSPTHQIFVVPNKEGIIIATGTLLIEQKLIHNLSKVAHIEDVVICQSARGTGLGKYLIHFLLNKAKHEGCYKSILNCSNENVEFYKKCGLEVKGEAMVLYY